MIEFDRLEGVTVEYVEGAEPKFTLRFMNGNEDMGPCVFGKSTVEWFVSVREIGTGKFERKVKQTGGKYLIYQLENFEDHLLITSPAFKEEGDKTIPLNTLRFKIFDNVMNQLKIELGKLEE